MRRVVGDAAFATWEEAELMEVPMVDRARARPTPRRSGVEPDAHGATSWLLAAPRPEKKGPGSSGPGPETRSRGVDRTSGAACDGAQALVYIIPPMSGMPPPIAAPSFSGISATIASVVRMFLAIDAAF